MQRFTRVYSGETLDLRFEISDLTWIEILCVGTDSEGLFRAGTVESVSRHDFFRIEIAIGIVIEALLSGHAGSNNTGSWGLSTTQSTSVRPIDPDPDSDSDFE
jgi:hypothetical protein